MKGATLNTRHEESIVHVSAPRAGMSRAVGGALLVAIYAVAACASVGLFRTPSTDAHRAACVSLGLLNVAMLPLLVLVAALAIRRAVANDDARRIPALMSAPLWVSFTVALLTVPLGMGMANSAQTDAAHAALGASATFLLAPWGFMLAYGCALLVVRAMWGIFPVTLTVSPQSEATT